MHHMLYILSALYIMYCSHLRDLKAKICRYLDEGYEEYGRERGMWSMKSILQLWIFTLWLSCVVSPFQAHSVYVYGTSMHTIWSVVLKSFSATAVDNRPFHFLYCYCRKYLSGI